MDYNKFDFVKNYNKKQVKYVAAYMAGYLDALIDKNEGITIDVNKIAKNIKDLIE